MGEGKEEEEEREEGQGREDGTCNRELQMGIFSAVTFKKKKKKMLKKWRYVTANLSLNGRDEKPKSIMASFYSLNP